MNEPVYSKIYPAKRCEYRYNYMTQKLERIEKHVCMKQINGVPCSVVESEVTADMLASGDRLMDLPLPDDELVVTVKRDGAFFIPNGRSKLCLGDKLLVISHSERGQLLQTK